MNATGVELRATQRRGSMILLYRKTDPIAGSTVSTSIMPSLSPSHIPYVDSSSAFVASLIGHSDKINSIAIHPNDLLLATGSADHTIKVWTLTDFKEKYTFIGAQY